MPNNLSLNSQTTKRTFFPVDVYQGYKSINATDGLIFLLSILSFFIHPFFILILAALLQVYVKIKPVFFLPMFCLSLAMYWSLRNIGVSWEGGFDDAVAYLERFHSITKGSISALVINYIEFPAGNEIGFNLFVYFVRLFTDNERIFLFVIYLSMLAMLSFGAIKVSQRYYLVIIALIFFGMGGFVEQAALHLFRATLASLILFMASSIYNHKRLLSYFLLVLSAMFHTAAVPLILFFLIITHKKTFSSLMLLMLVSFFIVLLLKYFVAIDSFLLSSSRASYISDGGRASEVIKLLMITTAFFIFRKVQIENIYKFSFFVTFLLIFFYLMLPEYAFIAGRYLYLIQLFTALLVFKFLMNFKYKPAICSVLLFFFYRKIIVLNSSDFINGAFDDFSNIFSAPLSMFIK